LALLKLIHNEKNHLTQNLDWKNIKKQNNFDVSFGDNVHTNFGYKNSK